MATNLRQIVPMMNINSMQGNGHGHEDLRRVWALYKYTEKGVDKTIEGRFHYSFWYNFCGGMLFFSPQVRMYGIEKYNKQADTWNTPTSYAAASYSFACPSDSYYMWHDKGLRCDRELYDSTYSKLIPSLNELFKIKSISGNEAYEIMWNSMAAALLSSASYNRKRWLVGADHDSGQLKHLVDYVKTFSNEFIYDSPFFCTDHMIGTPYGKSAESRRDYWRTTITTPSAMSKLSVDVDNNESLNWNSGNPCIVPVIILNTVSVKGGESHLYGNGRPSLVRFNNERTKKDYPELKFYEDIVTMVAPYFNSPEYSHLIPAYNWAN